MIRRRARFALVLSLLALACQRPESQPAGSTATAAPSSNAAPESSFKVGLLTPGSVNDNGWNALAYDGLQKIHNDLHVEVSNQEAKTPVEIEEGFRSYGANGYTLVFGHGFEFSDPAKKVGAQFPKTTFITTSGSAVSANVAPMVFELEQATYLCGMIAARESKTGKAGLVGGRNIPSIASTFLAFTAGAHAVNPKFEVKEIYTGNFDDLGAAKLATLTLINDGCDFIFHQANEAGRGVFQACQERKVRCFGSNKDQKDLAPDVIVASAVLDVPSALVQVARRVHDHQFHPEPQRLGMKDGVVSLVWNDALKAAVSAATLAELQKAEAAIRDGSLTVPRGKF